jgi:N-acetylmuramic acid 6-phosphate etherase
MATSKWEILQTEAVNPATNAIDTLTADDVVDLMIQDSRHALDAVGRERAAIGRGVGLLESSFRCGGRIVFVGAGTSGRLGVLEAAEMPPTFGLQAGVVRAVMAGGVGAVARAREGVEDDSKAGDRAIRRLRLKDRDVVVGISASGVTPFVNAALVRAKLDGARVIAITCNSSSPLGDLADVWISLNVGPEVIAGSTRLKAATATKVVLNALTTTAMVRVGKTYGNLMVDVQATSAKLRDRGRRIVCAATGLNRDAADRLLRRAKGNVKAAIVMQVRGLRYAAALQELQATGGSVRRAVGER